MFCDTPMKPNAKNVWQMRTFDFIRVLSQKKRWMES